MWPMKNCSSLGINLTKYKKVFMGISTKVYTGRLEETESYTMFLNGEIQCVNLLVLSKLIQFQWKS